MILRRMALIRFLSTSSSNSGHFSSQPQHATLDFFKPIVERLRSGRKFKETIEILCKEKRLEDAVGLLEQQIYHPPEVIYSLLLKLCIQYGAIEEGKRVHKHIKSSNFTPRVFLSNKIIELYCKCNCVLDARKEFDEMGERDLCSWNTLISTYARTGQFELASKLFDEMPERDSFSWTAMVSGYVRHDKPKDALELFRRMQVEILGATKFSISYSYALSASSSIKDLRLGKEIHGYIMRSGLDSDARVCSSLSRMYAKCGSINEARYVFDRTLERDVVLWTLMIDRYFKDAKWEEGFLLFSDLLNSGVAPDKVTFIGVLNACAHAASSSFKDMRLGKEIHGYIVRSGLDSDAFVRGALSLMYGKCGSIDRARYVFDRTLEKDVVLWTMMMNIYFMDGRWEEGFLLFSDLLNSGVAPNEFTFAMVLNACALAASCSIKDMRLGKEIHGYIVRSGLDSDAMVRSALSHMYGKCGSIDQARYAFDRTWEKDVVLWTAMIDRYFKDGMWEEGFSLFSDLLNSGVAPNEFTFAGVLKACARQSVEGLGKQVHGYMMRSGFDPSSHAASALIYMYSKCGNMSSAYSVFSLLRKPNLASWSSLINGYAQNGQTHEFLRLFELLLSTGIKLNDIIFVGVLSACAHAGLVDKGIEIFYSIEERHGLMPTVEHYACVIDLLSRAGRFEEAKDLLSKMPMKPNKAVWTSLLGGCRIHGNLELAKDAADALMKAKLDTADTYATLANIYATSGKWDEAEKVRKAMKRKGLVKKPGWIYVNRKTNVFLVGDNSHHKSMEICEFLSEISKRMKQEGYIPDTDLRCMTWKRKKKKKASSITAKSLQLPLGLFLLPLEHR